MAHPVEADLERLLERLKSAQRDLLIAASKASNIPSDGMMRKISELEGVIAATEALLQDERERDS